MNCGVTVAVFLAVTVSLVLSGKISLFIYYLMIMAIYQTIWCRIVEFLVTNELNRIWKDMVVP